MKPSFRQAFERAGIDTTRRPSEVEPSLARDEIYHAAVNCELMRARAKVRAKLMIQQMNQSRRGR